MRGASGTPRAQEQEALQLLKPTMEGGGSRRHDGIARQGQRRLDKPRSDDRAAGDDNEVVLGHQQTSEEARGASESAATSKMAPGEPFLEENRLLGAGGSSPQVRENAPEGAQGQEPLHRKQQLPPRPCEASQETETDAFECKHNIADVIGLEEEPPDTENNDEDSRSPVETERCPEPRTAKSRRKARR